MKEKENALRDGVLVVLLVRRRIHAELVARTCSELARLELAIGGGEAPGLKVAQRARRDGLRALERRLGGRARDARAAALLLRVALRVCEVHVREERQRARALECNDCRLARLAGIVCRCFAHCRLE